MIVIIDNYDSFTYNLVQALGTLGAEIDVRRNDAIDVERLRVMNPSGIVLSPGPGRPEGAGCCVDVVRNLGGRIPILGVCLGHQAIGVAFGATVQRAPEVVHGKTAPVTHHGEGLFRGLPAGFEAARYHSLVVAEQGLPEQLQVDATAPGGLIMALSHRQWPIFGVQFHPESIVTPAGPDLLRNFLELTESTSC